MPFQYPKLSPLQSRFFASLLTLVFLGFMYWSFYSPPFAYAAELDVDGSGLSRDGADHNWHRIEQESLEEVAFETSLDEPLDEYEFGDVVSNFKRADTVLNIDGNDSPNVKNIQGGETAVWFYSNDLRKSAHTPKGPGLPSDPGVELDRHRKHHSELKKRGEIEERQDGGTMVYISINTCLQPTWKGSGVQTDAPPQLTLYVSTSTSNKTPGPGERNNTQTAVPLDEGFANLNITVNDGFYLSVHAPSVPGDFEGVWNYELAVSIDGFYHAADPDDPFLFLVDTDTKSALLVTDNLTQSDPTDPLFQKWMNLSTPFIMFAANQNHTSTMGIMNSFCGWSQMRQIEAKQDDPEGKGSGVQMGMITRGLNKKPKEQFYVTNLNSSSDYNGVLAINGNSTKAGKGVVGGGGKVWKAVDWTTKSDGNCALLFNLTFCDEVAYAVPSNPNLFNIDQMRQEFDNYTSTYYQNFNYSLQQVACNTSSDSQYSLAKTCTDCASAYKTWLCAVSIPRCQDYSDTADYLQIRNVGAQFLNGSSLSTDVLNTPYLPMSDAPTLDGSPRDSQTLISSFATNRSRNMELIDAKIKPGPYKELLPCEDLCWGLVQSCPASLGFACPHRGRGLEAGYGKRSPNNNPLTCSFLGAVYTTNAAVGLATPVWKAIGLALLAGLVVALD